MTSDETENTLAARLARVAADCSYVQKDANNTFHKYRYASAAAILGHVNDALVKHGVAVLGTSPTILSDVAQDKGRMVTVRMEVLVGCATDAARCTFVGLGSGQDTGDKAVMKASTAALKYAWMGALSISTGDDPEADEETDQRNDGAQQQRGAKSNGAKATAPAQRPNPLHAPGVGIERPTPARPREADAEPQPAVHPTVAAVLGLLPAVQLPGEAVALWMKWRAQLAPLPVADREAAWRAVCERTGEVGRMANPKVWLKKAIAEEDARAATTREPGDEGPDDEPPAGGAGASSRRTRSGANGSAATTSTQAGPVGLVESWMGSEEGVRGYLSQRAHWNALENAVRKHSAVIPAHLQDAWGRMATWRLQTLSADATGAVLALDGCKALVAKWRAEGPRREVAQRAAAAILTTAAQLGMVA